jgi:hypothetical protein
MTDRDLDFSDAAARYYGEFGILSYDEGPDPDHYPDDFDDVDPADFVDDWPRYPCATCGFMAWDDDPPDPHRLVWLDHQHFHYRCLGFVDKMRVRRRELRVWRKRRLERLGWRVKARLPRRRHRSVEPF